MYHFKLFYSIVDDNNCEIYCGIAPGVNQLVRNVSLYYKHSILLQFVLIPSID